MVNITINGKAVQVPEKTTILKAAQLAGINLPTLCHWEGINEIGACRVCVVEVEGYDKLFTACNNTVDEGMVIYTNSKKARIARKNNVELILSQHNTDCPTCVRSGNCALQKVSNELNISEISYEKNVPIAKLDKTFPFTRDDSKCIKCMRCVQVCDNMQNTHVWDVINTGSRTTVGLSSGDCLDHTDCAICGQCVKHCPVGALRERDDTDRLFDCIEDPEKIVVMQIAPSIRAAWGEPFGLDDETASMQRLCAAFKEMGVDYVFDTDFAADLTIMEEANEFVHKLTHADDATKFPMFTSFCPAWIRHCKAFHPDFVDQLSTSKSPQQMFGPIAKTYYANILGVDPKNIVCVSVMPCVAKKKEAEIPVLNDACGEPDVDFSITTREVARMIKAANINPAGLEEIELDMPLGIGTGAGHIFGATGGVMEAALRTAYNIVTGKNADPDAFKEVRGQGEWRELTLDVNGITLKIAVVHTLGAADRLLDALRKGEVEYHFVEVMACPGGCVNGGGQPIVNGYSKQKERADILYKIDKNDKLRFSHENPSIIAVYKDFLGEPLSELAEKLLHTDHHAWKMYNEK